MNKLLLSANEKKLGESLNKLRVVFGNLSGGERALVLRSTNSRNTAVLGLLRISMDLVLALHERDDLDGKESELLSDAVKLLASYDVKICNALFTDDISSLDEVLTSGRQLSDEQAAYLKTIVEAHEHSNVQDGPTTKASSDDGKDATALSLLMDSLVIEVEEGSLGQPYQLERDEYLANAKGRTIHLVSDNEAVLSVGQKGVVLPAAFGEAKLQVKVSKKGDEPAEQFELNVTVKPKA